MCLKISSDMTEDTDITNLIDAIHRDLYVTLDDYLNNMSLYLLKKASAQMKQFKSENKYAFDMKHQAER